MDESVVYRRKISRWGSSGDGSIPAALYLDGLIIYVPTEGDETGYPFFPSTPYRWIIECMELRTGKLEDGYEYPVYYMLKQCTKRIEHIMVNNDTKIYEDAEYLPDCVLSTGDLGSLIEYHGILYNRQTEGSMSIYIRQ